jgi:hypothetical protein
MTRSRTLTHDPRDRLSLQRLFDSPSHQANRENHNNTNLSENANAVISSPSKIERKPMGKRGSVREKFSFSNNTNNTNAATNENSGEKEDLRKSMMKRTSMQKTLSQNDKSHTKKRKSAPKVEGEEESEMDEDQVKLEDPEEAELEVGGVARRLLNRRNSDKSKSKHSESPSRKRKPVEEENEMLVGEQDARHDNNDRRLKKQKLDNAF